jgi:phospholipase C
MSRSLSLDQNARVKIKYIALIVAIFLVAYVAVNLLTASSPFPPLSNNPIKHVVVVMQENRTFDNYFGTYPGAKGIPPRFCMHMNLDVAGSPCIPPFLTTDPVTYPDMPHNWLSSHVAYDSGKMDGFIAATGAEQNTNVMSYYDNQTLPNLWAYASHYVLADNFFTSTLSASQPNHWYMVAGKAPTISILQSTSEASSVYVQKEYINQSQVITTIADSMTNSGISWKYYDTPIRGSLSTAITTGAAFSYLNPFLAKNLSYTGLYSPHFVARANFFSDVANGTLPQVSWVTPSGPISDHPPANITLGMYWITDVVDAVMRSQYWNSTVIIVLWDDYGGFFDTVAPPQIDGYGLSFRCPALIISAYSKTGYIDHTLYSFESTLKFIEWRFGMGSLTGRDSRANNMFNAFNFNQSPAAPYVIPLTNSQLGAIARYIGTASTPPPNPFGLIQPPGFANLSFIGDNPD